VAYYGDYYRGDYYRGDYYRGDPIFGALAGLLAKPAIGLVRKAGAGLVKLALGKGAKSVALGIGTGVAVEKLVSGSGAPPPMILPPSGTLPPPGGMKVAKVKGVGGAISRALPGGATGYEYVKRKRMNVTNVKALRRAIRRATGFAKLARKCITFVSPRAPKGKAIFKTRRKR